MECCIKLATWITVTLDYCHSTGACWYWSGWQCHRPQRFWNQHVMCSTCHCIHLETYKLKLKVNSSTCINECQRMACHTRYLNDKVFEELLGALDITSIIASIHELCLCYSELNRATSLCLGHTSTEKLMYICSVVLLSITMTLSPGKSLQQVLLKLLK